MTQHKNTTELLTKIMETLDRHNVSQTLFSRDADHSADSSAVLFLLGQQFSETDLSPEPTLILNKRSQAVKQPGDLCCPGGGIASHMDAYLAKLLLIPGSPLKRWPYWKLWKKNKPEEFQRLIVLFAAALREGLEEMRLNPFGVKLLGPMPAQRLVMFKRVIYPIACWLPNQKRFSPNWEVDKIIHIPIRRLLDPSGYACYQLQIATAGNENEKVDLKDVPGFVFEDNGKTEILWGATYRITMHFLEMVFDFKPPEIQSLQVINGVLNEDYLTGGKRS
jgi:hypothetical protein